MTTRPNPAQRPQFFDAMVDIAVAELCAHFASLKPRQVRSVLQGVAGQLQASHAGRCIYVRTARHEERQARNALIRQQYGQPGPGDVQAATGKRVAQLALTHRLTERQVRTILAGGASS